MFNQREREEATRCGAEDLRILPRALSVQFHSLSRLVEVHLNTGYTVSFSPQRAQDLANASNEELAQVEVSGVGFGIYFPLIDTDLWVPSIAKGRFGNDRWEAAWIAAHPLEDAPPVFEHQDADETVAA